MKKCLLEECENLTNNYKFCSLSCGAIHQHRNTVKVPKFRECKRENCSNIWKLGPGEYDKVYCSRSCAAMVNNLNRAISKKRCLQCSSPLLNSNSLYCNQDCGIAFRQQTKIALWLSGEWDATTKTGLSGTIRSYLIEQANHRCSSPTCAVPGGFAEINPVTGRVPLEVDHLDGNCYNNTRENLMVVCPNCHALTPTYRALNKGSGRAYRRGLTS